MTRVLVTGVTGTIGRQVSTQLRDAGVDARGITRELTDPEALRAALDGVDAVFLLWPLATADGAREALQAVAERATRVVYLSSAAVREHERAIERLVEESGLRWTVLRPHAFAANTLRWAEQVRAGEVRQPPAGGVARPPPGRRTGPHQRKDHSEDGKMIKIGIIVGSTRPGRNGEAVARWVHELAAERGDADYELVDLKDFELPHLDEAMAAATGVYHHPHTKAWSDRIAAFDGYVFVTPEYNHSTTGVLKTAIDFLFAEWHDKAAGVVGYGVSGGVRAAEHLRQVLAQVKVADVQAQVELLLHADFADFTTFRPAAHQEDMLAKLLDQVVSWSTALRTLRV